MNSNSAALASMVSRPALSSSVSTTAACIKAVSQLWLAADARASKRRGSASSWVEWAQVAAEVPTDEVACLDTPSSLIENVSPFSIEGRKAPT
jgi:hypothetical protein